MNENFEAVAPGALFARKATTTTGLTWGYYGGIFPGTYAAIVDGSLTLTDASTNYIECDNAGVLYQNTSAFTVGRNRLYQVVCAGGVISSYTDYRQTLGIAYANVNQDNTWTGQNTFNIGTITANKPFAIDQTWNNAGITFEAFDINVTDIASAAGSFLANWRVGGATKLSVDKTGALIAAGLATFNAGISIPTGQSITGAGTAAISGFAGITATNLTGTLATAAQPNVTSVGTLTSLNVTGNVGVGVTPQAWNAVFKVVELGTSGNGGYAFVANQSGAQTIITENAFYDSAWKFAYTVGNRSAYYEQLGGVHNWYASTTNATAGTAITWSKTAALDLSGNLTLGPTGTGSLTAGAISGTTGTFSQPLYASFLSADYPIVAPRSPPLVPGTGALTSIGAAVASGANPRYIVVDPTGRFAYVANFGAATVSMYSINSS
ncbi:MAG: hypothetical protein B7X10_03380, partial [Burkholderiales bacterium 21-58-4]